MLALKGNLPGNVNFLSLRFYNVIIIIMIIIIIITMIMIMIMIMIITIITIMILFVKADQNFNNFYFFAKWGNLNLVKYTRSIFAKSSSSKNVTIGHQTRAHALDTVHNTFN